MIKMLFSLLALFLVATASSAEIAFTGKYTYQPAFENVYAILDMDNNFYSVLGEHEGFTVRTCSDKAMKCFSVENLWFAVPDKSISIGDSWKVDGHCYRVTESVDGKKGMVGIDYLVIRSSTCSLSSELEAQFMYSNVKGLLGMQYSDRYGNGGVWLLASKIGFPK